MCIKNTTKKRNAVDHKLQLIRGNNFLFLVGIREAALRNFTKFTELPI